MHFNPLVQKCQTPIILADLLGNESLLQRVQKIFFLWFVIGGFRSVLWVSVFQGSLLVILLWPKPDVNIPNIFDRFHPWTWLSNFDEAKPLKIHINFWDRKSAIKNRVLAELSFRHASYLVLRRSHGIHSPRLACLLALFTLARIACLLHICIKTSRFHYSIWATPK